MAVTSTAAELRTALASVAVPNDDTTDFRIALQLGPTFIGRGKDGSPAILVPLESAPGAAGRRGGGFALRGVPAVAFDYDGRRWEQAAATLECTEVELLDSFLVLAIDLARRLASDDGIAWQTVVACVDEWQTLLARRSPMTVERQLGLWAELWMISVAIDADRLVAAWRGPEADSTDFFLDGAAVELKASRQQHVHHISARQVPRPVGDHDAYLLSFWVGMDPIRGVSLSELFDRVLARVGDAPAFHKQAALVGYAAADREQYVTKFVPLEEPLWFRTDDVPRVRSVDAGVSQIRYVATLDPDRALAGDDAKRLWHHFCRAEPPPIR